MQKTLLTIYTVAATVMLLSLLGCNVTNEPSSNEVTIGEQIWMSKNLNVITFRNGDTIPEAKSEKEWKMAGEEGKPAWCHYNNDSKNAEKYGKLYNWYAINDSRGLAPKGWHVPNNSEWDKLNNHLGDDAGTKMKSKSGWNDFEGRSGGGTNSSGFSGLPVGCRAFNGTFYGLGFECSWWSSSESAADYMRGGGPIGQAGCNLNYAYGFLGRNNSSKEAGFSVRCLRD